MLYTFCKYLIRISVELFFRKKYIHHLKALNTRKPLLVCMNHPSAFLDAVLVMVLSKRKFHVLVRGDVFEVKWISAILHKLNLIPIFRMKDGFDQLEKNNQTFDETIRLLEQGEAIIIFPEANCEGEKRLRKLSKGTAKLAFMAEERNRFGLGLELVALGVNYERLNHSGGYLHLRCGNPFAIKDFEQAYKEDKNKAFKEVTDKIELDLREQMIIVEYKEHEDIFDKTVIVHKEWKEDFRKLKAEAANIEHTDHTAVHRYFEWLKRYGMTHSVAEEFQKKRKRVIYKQLIRTIDIIILFPVFVIGALFNAIPFYLPYYISKSIFKKDREFDSSISLAGSAILFFLFYLIYFIVFSVKFGLLSASVLLLLIAMCGLVAFVYRKEFRKWISSIRYYFLKKHMREELAGLYRSVQ